MLLILVTSHKIIKTKFLIKPKQSYQRLWSHQKVTYQKLVSQIHNHSSHKTVTTKDQSHKFTITVQYSRPTVLVVPLYVFIDKTKTKKSYKHSYRSTQKATITQQFIQSHKLVYGSHNTQVHKKSQLTNTTHHNS